MENGTANQSIYSKLVNMPIPLLTRFRNHPTKFNELEDLERKFLDLTINDTKRFIILQSAVKIILGSLPGEFELSHILSAEKDFTKHHIFRAENNLRGLHLFRMVFSYYASVMRSRNSIYSNKYHTLGYVQINNFLSEGLHSVAHNEIKKVTQLSSNKQPFNQLQIDETNIELYDAIRQVVLGTIGLKDSPTAQRLFMNNTFIQKIINKPDDDDIQKVFHSDIFFPAVKFWYYPEEVTHEGALQLVPNSADLTNEKILEWHYHQSCKATENGYDRWRGIGHKQGSLRIAMDEIRYLGLYRQTMKVKPNTLIVANVNGFHRRSDVSTPTHRNAIHGSIRIHKPMEVHPE